MTDEPVEFLSGLRSVLFSNVFTGCQNLHIEHDKIYMNRITDCLVTSLFNSNYSSFTYL